MSSVLNEHEQFVDSSGKPLVNGKVYFGVQGADPTVSPITIYSNRELTSSIANPQLLDSLGRTVNKVWVPGRYSMRVDDVNDAQVYQQLDNGESADKGITVLDNVSGGNTIIATAASTITAYEDLEQYTFRTAQVNTTSVTLNIDTIGAKSVVKNHDKAILPGDFEADQNVVVTYNDTDDTFEWVNQNAKTVSFYEAPNVVASTTTDIWGGSGNTIKITGNTAITSFGTAPNEGAIQWVTFSGTPTLTYSANLNLQGGVDFTASDGDFMRVYADSPTQFDVQIFKASGEAVVAPPGITLGTPAATTSGTSVTYASLPAGIRRISVMFSGVSTSGSSIVILQLGNSGGIVTSGYAGSVLSYNATASFSSNFSTGFAVDAGSGATSVRHGSIVFELLDESNNTWSAHGVMGRSDSTYVSYFGGTIVLTNELDRVRLFTAGGSDTFDAGKMNISYE